MDGLAVTFQTSIREMFRSNLGRAIDYPDWGLPQFSWGKCRVSTSISHDSFFPDPSEIITHQSPYRSRPYNLPTDSAARYNVKLSLCLINYSRCHGDVWGSGGIDPGTVLGLLSHYGIAVFSGGYLTIMTIKHRWRNDWAVSGIGIGRGNRSTRRKPTPVPLCPPQIPHYLTCDWNGSKDLTTGSRAGSDESCPRCSSSVLILSGCRDSSVGIVTGYRPDVRGVRVRVTAGVRFIFLSMSSGPVLGPPSNHMTNGYRG
jgi:hypothetical protein